MALYFGQQPGTIRSIGTVTLSCSTPGQGKWPLLPVTYWTVDDLRQNAHEAAVIEPEPRSLQRMKDLGLQPIVRNAYPLQIFYLRAYNP
jgi:hypothetical protein